MEEPNRPGPELEALIEGLRRGDASWSDLRVPALLSWFRDGERRSELQALLRSTAASLATLSAARVTELVELLQDLGLLQAAFALSALPQHAADAGLAALRARLAMQLRDYPAALAASEVAIAALLQPGVSLDEFLRLCSAGAPAEGMLRFERHTLAQRVHLCERLGLRWEALHRTGQTRDASLMQLMCQRYFPERASVWATAGNHALDGDDLAAAEGYFQRCLTLDSSWTAALAGLAIVHERRKDWSAALPYRRRVLEVEGALTRDDAASVQRRLRYAAALARLGRWREAEPLFRGAARAPALSQLPAEQPVLLRVFSQELYAPALAAALAGGAAQGGAADAAAVTLAQHEAALLAQLEALLPEHIPDPAARRWSLALCAYLAGELERAYVLLDQIEVERPSDLAVHCLLARCASAIAHPEATSIRSFAEQAARAAWTAAAPADQQTYVLALVPELAAARAPSDELEPLAAPLLAQLERLVAYRTAHAAAGHSPLLAAAASSHALAALLDSAR